MAFHFKRLLQRSICTAALAAALAAGSGAAATAQPTGVDLSALSTPHSRALDVLRQMQRDSVKIDSRHWQAAQRCDRAAMAEYLRQLDELAAQARNVIRNAGLENDTSSNALTADQIAENIEMRARHAASRQPENCGGSATQEGTGTTGTTGGSSSSTAAEQLLELEKESILVNSRHYEAAQRCDRAAMEQFQRQLDILVDEAGRVMVNASRGPRGTRSARFKNAENSAHNIARRAEEARKRQPKNCPEQTRQDGGGTGSANTTGSTPQQQAAPPPPPAEPQAGGAKTGQSAPPAQGLSGAAQEEAAATLEDAEKIEKSIRQHEEGGPSFVPEFEAWLIKQLRDEIVEDLRFTPEAKQQWLKRLDRIWEKLPPDAKASVDAPMPPDLTPGQKAGPSWDEIEAEQKAKQAHGQGQPEQPRTTPKIFDPLNILGGRVEQEPASGSDNQDRGGLSIFGVEKRQRDSTGNTSNSQEPASKVRDRPPRDRRRDRCEGEEGQKPADCPKQ